MLCTDIQVPAEEADKAFIRAWNFMVSHGLRYAASFREMARLLQERGRIRAFDYGLALKILDHIEVTQASKLAVIFLTGTKVII